MEHVGTGIHRASLVGHGNLRKLVVGYENRPATDAELAEMGRILGELLDQGALGLSTGLIYPPGCFAGTGELVALAGVAASRGKIYTSHIRGEGRNLLGAIDEVLHIAVEAGVRTQVSHLKASGPANWHKIDEALAKIEAVRSRGFEVMADRYPYTATNTGLDTVFRDWVHEGGSEAMLSRIVDASVRGRILEELGEDYPADRLSRVMISSIPDGPGKELEGRLVTAVARERGLDPHEAVLWILSTCRGEASAIFFSLSEEIMRRVLSLGWVMVATDATAQVAHPPHIEGFPHPRGYGTFSKVLGRFCREERLFPLETAIHKMTGLPARQLGLARRGTVAEGHHADLVVFDPATIRDESTYEAPHHYSSGITHVLVAGRVVLENGHLTGERPGRVLTRER
ncbi:MAG: amidohydrolase family protein [Candidatus Riflebacteria bacterium]|nr:amidohydrolase family protein [Candidatus Riflebacteria bacterium]